MGSEQQFCLRWHNYQSSLLASLPLLLDGDDLTDVTLMAGGCNLKAHRVVLSACSEYFKELFKVLQPLHHPVVVLPGTKFTDLCALVTFMYSGEVNIYQEQLQGLLAMADALQIRGLAEVNGNSGKFNDTLNRVPLKDDDVNSAVKRTKISSHSTLCSNKVLPHKETAKNLKHKADTDVYGCLAEGLRCFNSKQMAVETDSLSKNNLKSTDTFNFKAKTFMKNVPSQVFCQMGTNILSYIDKSHEASTPFSKEAKTIDKNLQLPEIIMKTEDNTRTLDASVAMELDSVLRNTTHSTLEEMELAAAKMCVSQDGLSPSSESVLDSISAGSLNIDFGTERMHLNPGAQSRLLSSHTKQWSNSQANNKLFATCFVCGKQLSNQYNLRVHMETHQNVNYACSVCSHVSRSRDALRKHVSYRHPVEAKEKSSVIERQAEGGRSSGEVIGDGHVGAGNKSKEASKNGTNGKQTNP